MLLPGLPTIVSLPSVTTTVTVSSAQPETPEEVWVVGTPSTVNFWLASDPPLPETIFTS